MQPYESLDLAPFRSLPPETWSSDLHRVEAQVGASVDHACLEIVRALGAPGPIEGIDPGRAQAIRWILARLADSGLAELDSAGRFRSLGKSPPSASGSGDSADRVRALARPTFELLDRASRAYPAFLRGEVDPVRVLFGADSVQLWERYFSNENLPSGAVNRLGAFVAEKALAASGLRVLEVGGGCGGAAEIFLETLGARVREYWFTELQPSFLRRGEHRIRSRFPAAPVRFLRADLDRPLAPQGIPEDAFDLVYAVNTLHVARDLPEALAALRRALRPEGTIVLVECVRSAPDRPVAIEFVFQMAPGFGNFLYWPAWRILLEEAGYAGVEYVPDLEEAIRAIPFYAVGAIVARRGR